jgi:hypothetical protein
MFNEHIEKCITIYDDRRLIALLIVNELELGYLDKKIVCYTTHEHKVLLEHVLSLFDKTQVNIRELLEKLDTAYKKALKMNVKVIITSFELISDVKNKTQRNKRILEEEGLINYVKVVKHVGIEKTKYIRKR